MTSYAWERAYLALGGLFAEKPAGWPARLAPEHLARLQCPTEYHAMLAALRSACDAGELAHELADFVFPPPAFSFHMEDPPDAARAKWRAQCTIKTLPAIAAADFVEWLCAQGEQPAPLIDAWRRETEGDGAGKATAPGARETPEERRARRTARFLELGGALRPAGNGWYCDGRRGALAALVTEESRAGRAQSDRSDVRKDLVAVAMEVHRGC